MLETDPKRTAQTNPLMLPSEANETKDLTPRGINHTN